MLVEKEGSEREQLQNKSVSRQHGKASGIQLFFAATSLQKKDDHVNWDGEQEPGRQVHLGGLCRKSCEDPLLEDRNCEIFKNRAWAVANPIDSFLIKNRSGKIVHVLRLHVMFGNPRSVPGDGNIKNR